MNTLKVLLLVFSCAIAGGCSTSAARLGTAAGSQDFVVKQETCHPKQVNYREAVIKLDTLAGSTASGVVISADRIITVAHAINDDKPLYAEISGTLVETRVLAIDRNRDLAYLEVDTMDIEPIEISSTLPVKGEAVWATGFPLASSQRVSTGFFEELSEGRLYTSVHINSGTSGGGLMRCEDGNVRLAGVVHGFVALRKNGSLINIGDSTSVSAQEIKRFVKNASTVNLVQASLDG